MENISNAPKKRGRKPKNNNEVQINDTSLNNIKEHKKRGRKPKGGKIITTENLNKSNVISKKNIILHLKSKKENLINNKNLNNNIDNFQFSDCKINYSEINSSQINSSELNSSELNSSELNSSEVNSSQLNSSDFLINNNINNSNLNDNLNNYYINNLNSNHKNIDNNIIDNKIIDNKIIDNKIIDNKLKILSKNLHFNIFNKKKSACFYCTYEFDNNPIYIPKFELNGYYYVYGCFCSPECACGYLINEKNISSYVKFERYQLLNFIYCKIYNYNSNIKPAPCPFHTLNKYYGNLTIQEYRQLLKNERLLLIIDKPLINHLPELHDEVSDANFRNNLNFNCNNSNNYDKKNIINENFNFK